MIKRFFILLLAIVASVGMSYALTPRTGDTWDDNTKTLTVNSDPDDYYNDQGEIKRLVISSSVTEIGEQAFSSSYNLESVIAYDGLQVIDQSAFVSCPKLESVILPSSLREVRYSAFSYCDNLKYVTINASSLDDYAEYAFDDTHADLKIYVPEASVATYKYFWSAYADKFQAIPSSLAVGDTLKVGDAMYSATDVYVSAGYLCFQIKASSLHTISVIEPNGSGSKIKVEITPYAEEFYPSGSYAALTNWFYCYSEYTSGDVTAITVVSGAGTLADPFVIDYVEPTAPAAPAWVRDGDTWDESTKTLTVNSNPGTEAYYQNTQIEHLIISDGVTTIGESAFDECTALLSVVIGNDVTNIEANAFDECGAMTSLTIGNKVQTIGESAFGSCESLTSVIIPNSVTSIGNSAFNTCDQMSSLTIGSGVQTIGESAFKNCSMLTDVTIPASVENIGAWFFRNCENLATITCEATTPPTLGNNAFFDCDKLEHIYVPAASVATYKAADNWATKEAIISAAPAPAPTVTWNSSNVSNLTANGSSYSKEGVTLGPNASNNYAYWLDYGNESENGIYFYVNATGGHTFSNSLGKNFTKIEMTLNSSNGWYVAYLGSGWNIDGMKVIWTGNASTVDLLTETSSFGGAAGVKSIVFYFEGGSEEPGGGSTDVIPCTVADLGKVLCTDGSIYATVSEATAASKTAAAVIAYVDTQNGKALALALADDGGTMEWAPAKTTAPAHTPAVSNGTWTLASKDDWNNMITAAGSYTALRDGFSAVGGTNMNEDKYWSSTPENDNAWCYYFNYGMWVDGYVDNPCRVRACLAFDIPAAPAYETVMNLINAIGTVELTAECKAKIDAARTAYNALSDGDKDLVTNIKTLTTAEAAFENVMNIWLCGDCDVILWNDTTLTVRKHAGEGNGAMADYNYMSRAPWYNSHWNDPKPGDIVIKSVTIEEGVTHLGDYAFAWMSEMKTVTIPSSVTTIPSNAFFWSKAVDDIYLSADASDLTWTLPNTADVHFKPNKGTNAHVPADLLTAYQEKFGALNVTFVGDLDPITPLTPEQQQALDAAKGLINAIPSPVVYTPACKDAIDAARAAYDALTPEMLKQLVSNYATLTAAETTYANLKDVAAVEAKINNIPQPVELTLATRDSIESARAAYEALTADQQALVTNYQTLLDAEAALAEKNPGGGMPAGALSGKFTINADGDQIAFAKGNLQATTNDLGANWTWGFAANQWNCLMIVVANSKINGNGTVSENGTVDLFGWSTAATYYGINNSDKFVDYPGDFVDWGPNMGAGWRTLTKDEWNYLIENNTKGRATVNDKNGYIFLPNDWSGPAFTPDPNNFTTNVYSGDDWTAMENAGAVFLPCGPARLRNSALFANDVKYYSSTSLTKDSSYVFTIYYNQSQSACTVTSRAYGCMVRLVTEGSVTPLDSAQAVKDLIEAIPVPVSLEDACVNAVQAARDAYNALADATKGALDDATVQKLNQAITDYTALIQAGADAVIAKINNIPQPVKLKLATRDSIQNARAAYDALTADQQALVSNYQTLLDAEAALAEKNQGGSASVDIVWDINTGIASVNTNTTSPAYEGITITTGNGNRFYQTTQDPIMLRFFFTGSKGSYAFAKEDGTHFTKVELISSLAMSDWLLDPSRIGTDWVVSDENKKATWIGDADTVKIWDGAGATNWVDVDSIVFTVSGTSTPLDSAQAVKDLIDAIPVPVSLEDACVNAVQAARDAYNALADATKGALDDATVQKLNQAIADYTALIQAGADEVIAKINAIPTQIELLISTKHAIDDARATYDALTADQKALVSNYQKLTDAENAWALIYAGHEDEMVQAEAVAALIEAIPDPVVLTSECENAINLANDAFSQLSNEQKAMLGEPLVQKLTDAVATYKVLADQDAAEAVIARIDAIPSPVGYSAECKEAISDARAAYDALSDEAKALVNADELKKLTDAEATYAALAAEREVNVAFLGKEQTVLYQETIALTKLPNGAPDENGWAFDHWEVMSTPMYAGLHLQAVYRYLITLLPQAYDTLMYNGLAQTLIAAGEAEEGHLEYRIGEGAWSTELPKATDAGAYAIQYKLVREGHEDFIAPDIVTAEIAKAPVAYIDPVAYDTLVYNYAEQELVIAGQTEDGTFEYTLTPTNENSWSTILSQGMNAGTYNVYFRVIGDMNHLDSVAPNPVAVSIAKRDIIVTAPVAYDTLVYNALAQTLAADAIADFSTPLYSLTSDNIDSWTENMVTGVNAGDYKVYYRVPGDDNHNDFETDSITVSIAKAPLTITANDTAIIYADAVPEFEASYSGWYGQDGADLISGLQFTTPYVVGSYVGTYDIVPSGATADNYTMTYVNGTLTVNKAHVYVSGAEAHKAKFADGHAIADVTEQGILNGIKLNDPIAHVTTAAFSSADVAKNLDITLFYELTGDAALLNNYYLDPTSDIFTHEGVIIEPFLPDNDDAPEDEEATVEEGIEVYAYGYCDGEDYKLKYHLNSGYPNQYKIEFEDSHFTDVDWTPLTTTGRDGTIDINIPVDLLTGDYKMTVIFRDSLYDWLPSEPFNVTFHVNLPETYVVVLLDNTIALIDTCHCLTDVQWYHRNDASELWQPIEGATNRYYFENGGLTGEYFVKAKMNGVDTYTCPQTDVETLYDGGKHNKTVVRAYPSPAIDRVEVSIENSDVLTHMMTIVNMMGSEIEKRMFNGNKTTLDVSGYQSGNYMISVDGNVVKVIKK